MANNATSVITQSGVDRSELDESVRPQDDLFRHVTGKWMSRTEIPADKARYGSFHTLQEDAEAAIRDIAERAVGADPGSEERKIGDLYTSFMNTERIEALGATPLEPLIERAQAVASIAELLTTVGQLEREGAGGFYQLFVDNDPGNPERYIVFFEQDGIGLPDESFYSDEGFEPIRDAYRSHIRRMLALAGLDDAAARADRVFELETAIASHHWSNVESRDSEKTYNIVTWADAREQARSGGAVDLDAWATGLDAPDGVFDEIVLRQPSFTEGLASLLTDENLPAWRDWLAWNVIHAYAPYLSEAFVEENFDFYGRTLTGTPQMRERWKRAVSVIEGALGEAAGRIYVAENFPPDAKAQMDALVAHLIEAYRQSIGELDWMSAATRERALEKLATFTPKIGYPDRWRDYASLEIVADDLLANVRAAGEFEFQRELGKIGRPLDRDEWFMTPQTVNAYYNPGFNEIVFPAAILQPPFFDPERDAASNFGAIGAVIGHEIGHGFDDQGSKYDGSGRLIDWWTEADRAAFEERTASLIDQYNALAPAQTPEHFVNGELTIGENIGDLGGLGIAWKAYLISLDGAEPPVIDGFTAAQRFFLAWADSWQQKGRDEETIRLLTIDPHAPNEFRCNQIVRNLDLFYEAFDVTENDALWLDPAERVTIW